MEERTALVVQRKLAREERRKKREQEIKVRDNNSYNN